ncbi:hypothetical protein GCM10017767_01850 [Halomonas urumqiensis]|nr:hypothetical protein GCM10017767_01850 [Halomonas urumqiensis]
MVVFTLIIATLIGDNKGLAALMMLLIGLFITMGIGSSFSTILIIASLNLSWRPALSCPGSLQCSIVCAKAFIYALGHQGAPHG